MAYKKAPEVSTYDTKRVSFIANPQQRSGTLPNKDFRLVNMMTEIVSSPLTQEKKYFVKSRPGLSQVYTTATGTGRGIYYWVYNNVGYTFATVGNTVYVNGVSNVTLSTSTGNCGFTEYLDLTGTRKLVMLDGTNGYVWTNPANAPEPIIPPSWAATTVYATGTRRKPTVSNNFFYEATTGGTSAGTEPTWPLVVGNTVVDGTVTWTCRAGSFPSPHIPTPIFLDAYLFVAKANSHDIYNSNLNDPLRWTAGDYISAEMYPDTIQALSKNNNYLYAIGTNSVEYMYDAANATGTPLARHDAAVQQFGTIAQGTVVQTEKEVIFVGETANGGHTVWTIDGFKEKEIGIPSVKQYLFEEGASLASATAYSIRVASQKLYVIRLTSKTLVYSFDTQMWSEWDSGTTGGSAFVCKYGHDGPNGTPYLLDNSNGKVYSMNEDIFTDAGTAFQCQIITSKLDFDNMNRKFMSRLALVGDIPDTTGTDNSITIDWTDDDYNTWATARTLSFNNDFPVLKQLGNFRRRAFRFKYALPHLLRLEGFEVDINKGNQ